MDKQEITQKIETELKLEGKSKHTISMYCYYNALFLDYCKKPPEEVTKDDIKLYLAYLISDRQLEAKTVSAARSALRYFYDEILKRNIVGKDVKTPKTHDKLPDVLTKDEVKKLLAEAKDIKTRLFVKLLYAGGLRVSEVAALEWDNLNFGQNTGLLRAGKGNRDRFFKLPQTVVDDLEKLEKSEKFVFPGKSGKHITTRSIQKRITTLAKKAGIKKKVYCHLLRHAFGTHLAENGTDIRIIQELMGHKSIRTTQIYTTLSQNVLRSVKSPIETL